MYMQVPKCKRIKYYIFNNKLLMVFLLGRGGGGIWGGGACFVVFVCCWGFYVHKLITSSDVFRRGGKPVFSWDYICTFFTELILHYSHQYKYMVFACLETFSWETSEFCLSFWHTTMNKFPALDTLVISNYLKKCYLDCFHHFKNISKIFIKNIC